MAGLNFLSHLIFFTMIVLFTNDPLEKPDDLN
jgi:hypothetical protein